MYQLRFPTSNNGGDYDLAGLMPAIRALMRREAGAESSEGRPLITDGMNRIAREHEIRLTGGNQKFLSKDTLDKMLSSSDNGHPPSILALVTFCLATKSARPMVPLVAALGEELAAELVTLAAERLGLGIMTDEARRDAEYGRACRMELEAKAIKKRIEGTLR